MRILITGPGGFVGSHLVPALKSQGHELILWGRQRGDLLTAPLPTEPVQAIVHLAAQTGIQQSHDDPDSFFRVNVEGTRRLAEFALAGKIPLVFLSTCAYGEPDLLPVPETHPLRPNNPYSESKKQAEELITTLFQGAPAPHRILRAFNIYGPGQDPKFVIPRLIEQMLSDSPTLELMNTDSVRDFIFIQDVVSALIAALQPRGPSGIYNLGTGVGHSIADVVKVLERLTGRAKKIRSLESYKPQEVRRIYADIGKIQRELPWKPRWRLAEGLEETLKNHRTPAR